MSQWEDFKRAGVRFSLPAPLASDYYTERCLSEGEERCVLLLSAAKKETVPAFLVLKWERQGETRLREEYRILSSVSHPAIVRAYGYEENEEGSFLWREYVPGRTLQRIAEEDGVFHEEVAVSMAVQVCGALACLHGQNPPVIHRDIKASNLVRIPGGCRIIDLDACRSYKEAKERDTKCLGTQATAAPEQFGYGQTDARSDVYAVGMLLIFLLTGVYDKQPGDWNVSPAMKRIIRRCIAFSPDDRYPSAAALQSALEQFLKQRQRRLKPLFPAAVSAVTTCVLLVFAAGIWMCLGYPQQKEREAGQISADLEEENGQSSVASPTETGQESDALPEQSPAGEQISSVIEENDQEESMQPTQEIAFATEVWEAAIRSRLGKEEDEPVYVKDLAGITELYVGPDVYFESFDEAMDWSWDRELTGPDDAEAMAQDFKLLTYCTGLSKLGVYDQEISDISALEGLPLEEVRLDGNAIMDLSPLASCTSLRLLSLESNPFWDISPLYGLSGLRCLYLNGSGVDRLEGIEQLPLNELEIRETQVQNIDPLLEMKYFQLLGVDNLSASQLETICRQSPGLKRFATTGSEVRTLEMLLTCENLEYLELTDTPLESLEGIEQLQELYFLGVAYTEVSDVSPAVLLPRLWSIDIQRCPVEDVSVLAQSPSLGEVKCTVLQEPTVREQLSGSDISLRVYE